MNFRRPADVREEFRAHPRRALIITTVIFESKAVKAHLTAPELLIGENSANYEYGRFADPAGEWLIVHALTAPGNSDAALVASRAHHEFGRFHAQMFVGVAGSLKEDIPIGSVIVGDYVYNAHSAKVEDAATLGRPHGIPATHELLTAAHGLIYSEEWRDLIRAPFGMQLPPTSAYPCDFPPEAVIKGIASGEEVVAGGKSEWFSWLRKHFNDCGAVEMEGWGAMNAAHHENTPAIIVRGISDMCAGKDHASDKLHQPIAAAHAAAFAFGILSFRSKVPVTGPVDDGEVVSPEAAPKIEAPQPPDRRIEFVLNLAGSKEDWPAERIQGVVERFKEVIDDEQLALLRVEKGSVRLVMNVRESDLAAIDLEKLRQAAEESGVKLLGAAPVEVAREADNAKAALAFASAALLAWQTKLPNGGWMERPERQTIENRFNLDSSSTVLLGDPGSGKSALLSEISANLLAKGATVFALKSDVLSNDVRTEADLQRELDLPGHVSDLVLRLAALQPVFVIIDQLDALASQLDLRSGRLNVLLNIVRRIGGAPNVHVLLSARTFEFNHDVRLRAVEAEAVTLSLPPWHEIKEQLATVEIDADTWPEKARDVVRIPQALKTFLGLVGTGSTEPFTAYPAMLEQLWRERIASAADSEKLIALATDLASQMAEDEVLWLAASRFDDRLGTLYRLEALGFVVRSESGLSVAFSHQTVFEYVLARTFVRNAGLLSNYVLERQDSLFVRPKVWAAFNYLRGAEPRSYDREFLAIWRTSDLRHHLRLLLIEFLGQVGQPLDFEMTCMAEVLADPELRIFGLKAIADSAGWFSIFASSAIRDAMAGSEAELAQAWRILALNWKTDADRVIQLIKDRWLPHFEKDNYSWMTITECPTWTPEVEELASVILNRTSIAIYSVDNTAATLAVDQPAAAMRLVRAKLDFLLNEAKAKPSEPPPPPDATDIQRSLWYMQHRRTKSLEDPLGSQEWQHISSLADAAPSEFLQFLWPWYVAVFSELVAVSESRPIAHIYAGQLTVEFDFPRTETKSVPREKPLMSAIQDAVEALATRNSQEFAAWADANSGVEILAAQQLIARGYELSAAEMSSKALDWLLQDERRFQLGTHRGHRRTTLDLVRACAPYWSAVDVARFEKAVIAYRPRRPDHLEDVQGRKTFANFIRASKKDLLQAIGAERLAPENRDLVATEQRALGDQFDRSIGEVEGGFIGSPMDAAAMSKAKDRDILKILREIPDNTDWNHPTHWLRGGSIQLSRAFAEFARSDPRRAVRLMELFEPLQQERAAAYALDALADGGANDSLILDAFLDLNGRGFGSDEFRESAARAIEKIANRHTKIEDQIIDILVDWLDRLRSSDEEVDVDLDSPSPDDELREGSILWGLGGVAALPAGSFTILSALASILLNRGEPGRDRYFEILDEHLARERNPRLWQMLLHELANAGGSTPQVVSRFVRKLFDRVPEIVPTRDTAVFLAYAQRWDDELVFDLIADWPKSGSAFLERTYGELVGLVAAAKQTGKWGRAREEIVGSGVHEARIGLAYAGVNLWREDHFRSSAGRTLVDLLEHPDRDLVAAVMDLFRVTDELVPDQLTTDLLSALARPDTDLSAASSDFVVERLQGLLPHDAEVIASIAGKLVAAWRSDLGDMRTARVTAAPQLTDLALTLHRMGGSVRQAGVALFEAMIEIDAYGAKETLAEIDGRFGARRTTVRQRLPRRRAQRSARRSAA